MCISEWIFEGELSGVLSLGKTDVTVTLQVYVSTLKKCVLNCANLGGTAGNYSCPIMLWDRFFIFFEEVFYYDIADKTMAKRIVYILWTQLNF